MTARPFDAVLVVAFGGPEGMGDVPLFLEMMADELLKNRGRYRSGRPLCLSMVTPGPAQRVERGVTG